MDVSRTKPLVLHTIQGIQRKIHLRLALENPLDLLVEFAVFQVWRDLFDADRLMGEKAHTLTDHNAVSRNPSAHPIYCS